MYFHIKENISCFVLHGSRLKVQFSVIQLHTSNTSGQKLRRLFLRITWLVPIFFLGAYGNTSPFCQSAFDSKKEKTQEEHTLQLAIQAESFFKNYHISQQKNETLTKLLFEIENILSRWQNTQYPLHPHEFIILKRKIKRVESILHQPINNIIKQQTQPDWKQLMENPSLIKANTPYFIEWPNMRGTAYIFFSDNIVDTFFNPKRNSDFQSNHLEVARRNINALINGYTNGDSTGIRILRRGQKRTATSTTRRRYNKLFEIRTLGKTAGHIRIGGFIYKNKLYIVHYVTGEHNKNRHALIHILLKKQEQFIHNGIY